jgi:pimeloyl-ACP methyl ester carboxylesterase
LPPLGVTIEVQARQGGDWVHPWIRAIAIVATLSLFVAAGVTVGVAQEPEARRYDIGERSLYLVCVGPEDSRLPTVIAESGLGGDSSHFGPLVPLLAIAPFRSCAYDRAGMGSSDPPGAGDETKPPSVTLQDGVDDLHALLAAARITPPYVLLGWSIGGWYVRAFAEAYPDEIAGMVLVDATHADEAARLTAVLPPERDDEDPSIALARTLLAGIEDDPPSAAIGWLDLAASGIEARELGDIGDLPLIVLSQGRVEFDLGLPSLVLPEPYGSRLKLAAQALQAELASLSTRGEQRTVSGAGHVIQYDDPEAVVQALLDMQELAAAGRA